LITNIHSKLNEPERAGISPQQAAQYWYSHMVPLRQQRGKILVSPSCANDDAGKRWLEQFMNLVQSQKPDKTGIHLYHKDGNAAIQYLQEMHNKYNLPLYITEMASIHRNYADVLYFTAQLCNFCDSTTWVDKYALFGFMPKVADSFVSPQAQLMHSDGSFRDLFWKYLFDAPIVANQQGVSLGEAQNAYH